MFSDISILFVVIVVVKYNEHGTNSWPHSHPSTTPHYNSAKCELPLCALDLLIVKVFLVMIVRN